MVDIFSLEVQSALSDLTDEQKAIFESTHNSKKSQSLCGAAQSKAVSRPGTRL